MLLDNRKGVEEQTRKLFDVCKLRRTPIFTLVNKCDRPGEDPLKLLDDVEADLGIACFPVTWPILERGEFLGVYDRLAGEVHLFEKGADHGQTRAADHVGSLDDPELRQRVGDAAWERLTEEVELLAVAGAEFDRDAFLRGEVSPTFFGSALTNFGIEPFLRTFLRMAPGPVARASSHGPVEPTDPTFSGFVFKIQANLDPRHRDRIAFLRICSGRYEPGMTVTNVRSEASVRLTQPQQVFGRERSALEEAWPGDVVGIHDRGSLRIGDTLSADGDREYSGIPRFSPEHFARVHVPDPLRRKHLDTGLRQLSEEGAAQVFYAESIAGPAPIVGAVGPLQFDVLIHRLDGEYNVEARLERLPYVAARWVVGEPDAVERVAAGYDRQLVFDSRDRPLILFKSEWAMRRTLEKEADLEYHSVAP
jgi:peptide chain release factor 3